MAPRPVPEEREVREVHSPRPIPLEELGFVVSHLPARPRFSRSQRIS
jgi:hypothetical protein